jgi:hypothetical protein
MPITKSAQIHIYNTSTQKQNTKDVYHDHDDDDDDDDVM